MKKLFLILVSVTVIAAIFSGCDNSAETNNHETQKNLLFVFHAKKGHLSINAVDPKTGTIVLDDIDSSVVYFTDRPERQAGKMKIEKFLELWLQKDADFSKNPPNSGFVSDESSDHLFNEVNVKLSNPQYEKNKKRLIFDFIFLQEEHPSQSMDFREPVLFVDGAFEKPR